MSSEPVGASEVPNDREDLRAASLLIKEALELLDVHKATVIAAHLDHAYQLLIEYNRRLAEIDILASEPCRNLVSQ